MGAPDIKGVRIICFRITAMRRQVKQLAAAAEKGAAQAERIRAAPSFRPLTEFETDAMVGGGLLAALAGTVVIR